MGLSINIIVHIFCQRAHHEAQRTTGESHGPELAALRVTNDPAPEQLKWTAVATAAQRFERNELLPVR